MPCDNVDYNKDSGLSSIFVEIVLCFSVDTVLQNHFQALGPVENTPCYESNRLENVACRGFWSVFRAPNPLDAPRIASGVRECP